MSEPVESAEGKLSEVSSPQTVDSTGLEAVWLLRRPLEEKEPIPRFLSSSCRPSDVVGIHCTTTHTPIHSTW
jgi:hypothetical protein